MKKLFFTLLTLITTTTINAQVFDGYYISKSGDTTRGKVQVPKGKPVIIGPSFTLRGRSTAPDPLKNESLQESKNINYGQLTFDFKFSEADAKFKKIDRLKVKGFGFTYEGVAYDYITWDITANKQIFLVTSLGDVDPHGVYFIKRSLKEQWPIYSLFQENELTRETVDNRPGMPAYKTEYAGVGTRRNIIFEHPTKGFIYISNQYPLKMKFAEALKYLELEEEFIKTLDKTDRIFEVVMKYNLWKKSNA